jgi:hypothetical protein
MRHSVDEASGAASGRRSGCDAKVRVCVPGLDETPVMPGRTVNAATAPPPDLPSVKRHLHVETMGMTRGFDVQMASQ